MLGDKLGLIDGERDGERLGLSDELGDKLGDDDGLIEDVAPENGISVE